MPAKALSGPSEGIRELGEGLALPEPSEELSEADLPPGRLANGCWRCIGCGRIVGKDGRWLNWCSDCGYDWWD
jgi:hypothetical protein